MTDDGRRRLARVLFAFVLVEAAIGVAFSALLAARPELTVADAFPIGDIGFMFAVMLFPILGVVLATRRPHNAIGWLMLAIGLVGAEPLTAFGEYALVAGLPGAALALSAVSWTWVPVIGIAGTFVLLLFPDGHLPSPRWRWFAWTIGVGMVVTSLAILFAPGRLEDVRLGELENAFGIEALRPLLSVGLVMIATIPIGIVGSAISLRARYRRSGPTERLQIRWLASAASVVALLYGAAMVFSLTVSGSEAWAGGDSGWLVVLQSAAVLSFALIPLSIAIAVLRYRLYDIDVVVRKAVVVAAIAVFFTAMYALVVGGIGAVVQDYSTTTLSFVAAALVALLFQPVLARSRRLATRIVYGKRATPYEVLSEFGEHVGGTYADQDVLPRMARVVGEGIGAASSWVWLERDGRLHVAASWGEVPGDAAPVPVGGPTLPELPGADEAFAVEDQGELLGVLAVTMPASDPMDEAKAKLVSDLAAQAGLVLRNARLTEALRQRLVDLSAAQKRLVAAQDEERRKLERNIHDGAQQQLVALSVKLRLAQSLVTRDPAKAEAVLTGVQAETQAALEDLRDLARGIYPPLLADKGLAEALGAQARRSTVPVTVEPDSVGRYPQEVEAAVYFSCLEALQNVAKYAEATHVLVRLSAEMDELRFEVADDGRGFDPGATGYGTGLQGIADRLAALDGSLDVRSRPGSGTTITGRVPVPPTEVVSAGGNGDFGR